ncbi:MAG: ABC transporter substrate-binding protein [Myxococcota bacterium]
MSRYPQRIVCLTEETVETLHLLGCLDLVVGVSGFAVRPKEVRRKPRVSAFISADIPKILALKPDLVMTFSDLQAEIVAGLVKAGVEVMAFNQRSLVEVYRAIRMCGALVGKAAEAEALAAQLEEGVERTRERARSRRKLRVFFEEWDDPLISAIGWVSELVEAAGGVDIFAETRGTQAASERVVQPAEVVRRNPEVIIGSWCGKKFRPERVRNRPGFDVVTAVQRGALHEVKSTIILQPGPAALTDGLVALERILVMEEARGS